MWWNKKKKKPEPEFSLETFPAPEDPPVLTPEQREAYRQKYEEYLAQLSPDELRQREEMERWNKELQEMIANGKATVIRGHNWEQVIVDGHVVEFRDLTRPDKNGSYPDM